MAILLLCFFSGAAALIYQVLWFKQLGLLFGNTSQAAAVTLAVFFLGLGTGSHFWGRRKSTLVAPLKVYAQLEMGVALSACLYFALYAAYMGLYPMVFSHLVGSPGATILVKLFLAFPILFLPSFFMGGTFPVLAQEFARTPGRLGERGAVLYSVNTMGAALGALAAGTSLPLMMGYRNAYVLALSINLVIAGTSWVMHLNARAPVVYGLPEEQSSESPLQTAAPVVDRTIEVLAVVSGALTLAIEVLWTRMFSLILQNSVYSFSMVLATFLLALAFGSYASHFLARRSSHPRKLLAILSLACGFAVAVGPWLFDYFTKGLADPTRDPYPIPLLLVLCLLVPGMVLGIVFPFLLRVGDESGPTAAAIAGRLVSRNTLGGILGSLVAGFLMLSLLGLWRSIWLVALAYVACGIVVLVRDGFQRPPATAMAMAMAVVALLFTGASFLFSPPVVSLGSGEQVIHHWEGSGGSVVTVKSDDNIELRVNNYYALGGSARFVFARRQGQLPLLLHPNPQSVFYLGLGTGITAGGAVSFPVKRIDVCENLPDVIRASYVDFQPWTNGLFDDPRVELIAEDGRNFLMATDRKYDVIISDLFIPWQAGIGSLYSLEHFENSRRRLNKGGLYAQWIPLSQLSRREFLIIASTMRRVFPQVTFWRCEFSPDLPLGLLLASDETGHTSAEIFRQSLLRLRRAETGEDVQPSTLMPYAFYVGNIGANKQLIDNSAINTDDRPLIEFLAPVTYTMQHESKENVLLTRENLLELVDEIQRADESSTKNRPEDLMTGNNRLALEAGTLLQRAMIQEQGHVVADQWSSERTRMKECFNELGLDPPPPDQKDFFKTTFW